MSLTEVNRDRCYMHLKFALIHPQLRVSHLKRIIFLGVVFDRYSQHRCFKGKYVSQIMDIHQAICATLQTLLPKC